MDWCGRSWSQRHFTVSHTPCTLQYNFVFKIVFIGSSIATVTLMRTSLAKSYQRSRDAFPHWILAGGCLVVAFVSTKRFRLEEIMWTFSILLECFAMLPQLTLLTSKADESDRIHGGVESITADYIFALGSVRLRTASVRPTPLTRLLSTARCTS